MASDQTEFQPLLLYGWPLRLVEKPIEVKVPVPVPCKAPDIPEPDWPLAKVSDTASDFVWFQATLAELALRAGYEIRLKAAVAACQ
ncbi:hypothetical protein [Comamonas guangdongensis]|uniref:Uncharacterized protein n=1 Tax=Comamonas guangdongensis TaxID=510515 RepID=A0ABV3ZVW3_9BURK